MNKRVGILAIHGSVAEHAAMLRRLKIEPIEVRAAKDLENLDGLILPGGESTTISNLADTYGLTKAIQTFARQPNPPIIYGTCAGLILLARWGLLDIAVDRNAYGRQIASFEANIVVPDLGKPDFPAVFIRAPKITSTGCGVRILASYDGAPILVQQSRIFGGSFHPELTDDTRIHALIFGEK